MLDNIQPPEIDDKVCWNDVSEFTKWWCSSGMPILPPLDAEVFTTDDATAICLYRKGQFQVELYLIHSNPKLDIHEHPGIDIVQMALLSNYGQFSPLLLQGMSHGDGLSKSSKDKGTPLLTFEHWKTGDYPSTAAAAWRGPTVGPLHEKLIRRYYPSCYIESGYADITKPSNYRQQLSGQI